MATNVNDAWLNLLYQLLYHGKQEIPRGQATREILGAQSRVDMRYPLLTVAARQLGYRFAPAEAWWIGTGRNDVAGITPYSQDIAQFSDDGVTYFGAYGPKVRDQLHHVVASLKPDPCSRQAVLTIWRENPPKTKDVPCTVAVQWLLRSKPGGPLRLHCVDTMRSSDIWLGWPYDVFNFSMLSTYVAARLTAELGEEVELGELLLQAGSQHLYERNVAAAEKCMRHQGSAFSYAPARPADFAEDPEALWTHLQALADRDRDALADSPSDFLDELLEAT
jgi:thymidylate synthase